MNEKTSVLSLRVPSELKNSLNALANATTRRSTDLILTWITERIEQESWQLQQVEIGLLDIENNQYASDEDIEQLNKKWGLVLN